MRKVWSVFGSILSGIAGIAGIAVLAVVLGFDLFYTYTTKAANASISENGFGMVRALVLAVLLIFILVLFRRKYSAKVLYICFGILYLICGLYFILVLHDGSAVISANGTLQGSTLFGYPIGFLSNAKATVLSFFADNIPVVFYLINLGAVLLINFMLYKITDFLLDGNNVANLIAVFISYTFVSSFLFITVLDFRVIGMCLFLVGIYFVISYHKNKNYKDFIFYGAFFLVLAMLADISFFFAIPAIVIFEFVVFFREAGLSSPVKRIVIFVLSLLIVSGAVCFGISYFVKKNNGDAEIIKTDVVSLSELKTEYNESESPVVFLKNKIIPVWGDHLFGYESFEYSLTDDENQSDVRTVRDVLIDKYSFDKYSLAEEIIKNWSCAICILLFLFSIIGVIVLFTKFHAFGISILFFISGMVMLTLIGGSSDYAYSYVLMLIPLASGGVAIVFNPLFFREHKFDFLKNVIEDKHADFIIEEAQKANEERKTDVILEEADKAVAAFEEKNKDDESGAESDANDNVEKDNRNQI